MARSLTRLKGIQAQQGLREQVADADLRNRTARPVSPMQAPGTNLQRSAFGLKRRGLQRVEQNMLEAAQEGRRQGRQRLAAKLAQDAFNRSIAEKQLGLQEEGQAFGQGMAERGMQMKEGAQQFGQEQTLAQRKAQEDQRAYQRRLQEQMRTRQWGRQDVADARATEAWGRGRAEWGQKQQDRAQGQGVRSLRTMAEEKKLTDYLAGSTDPSGRPLDAQGKPIKGGSRASAKAVLKGQPPSKYIGMFTSHLANEGWNKEDIYDQEKNQSLQETMDYMARNNPDADPRQILAAAAKHVGIKGPRENIQARITELEANKEGDRWGSWFDSGEFKQRQKEIGELKGQLKTLDAREKQAADIQGKLAKSVTPEAREAAARRQHWINISTGGDPQQSAQQQGLRGTAQQAPTGFVPPSPGRPQRYIPPGMEQYYPQQGQQPPPQGFVPPSPGQMGAVSGAMEPQGGMDPARRERWINMATEGGADEPYDPQSWGPQAEAKPVPEGAKPLTDEQAAQYKGTGRVLYKGKQAYEIPAAQPGAALEGVTEGELDEMMPRGEVPWQEDLPGALPQKFGQKPWTRPGEGEKPPAEPEMTLREKAAAGDKAAAEEAKAQRATGLTRKAERSMQKTIESKLPPDKAKKMMDTYRGASLAEKKKMMERFKKAKGPGKGTQAEFDKLVAEDKATGAKAPAKRTEAETVKRDRADAQARLKAAKTPEEIASANADLSANDIKIALASKDPKTRTDMYDTLMEMQRTGALKGKDLFKFIPDSMLNTLDVVRFAAAPGGGSAAPSGAYKRNLDVEGLVKLDKDYNLGLKPPGEGVLMTGTGGAGGVNEQSLFNALVASEGMSKAEARQLINRYKKYSTVTFDEVLRALREQTEKAETFKPGLKAKRYKR